MEKFATVSFETKLAENPDNVIPGGYFVWLTKNNQTVQQETIPATASGTTFTISEIGTYVARVVRLTKTGDSIGAAVESEPLVVVADKIALPISISLTIGDMPFGVKQGR